MTRDNLEVLIRCLQDFHPEPAEIERVAKGVQSTSDRVRALASDRLAFEDEPAAFGRALERTKLP
jgi:hypothetical protein